MTVIWQKSSDLTSSVNMCGCTLFTVTEINSRCVFFPTLCLWGLFFKGVEYLVVTVWYWKTPYMCIFFFSFLFFQGMVQSSSNIVFHQGFKARNIQIPGNTMMALHELLIFLIHQQGGSCCSFWGEPLTLDWYLLLILQIQQGQVK